MRPPTGRRRPLALQTPVTAFRNPDTGHRLLVVSTFHFGEPGYYQVLLDDITAYEHDGWQVQHEGSQHLTPAGTPTAEERAVLDDLAASRELEALRMSMLGWVSQHPVLHRPTWRTVDMADLDIIRAVGHDTMRAHLTTSRERLGWPDTQPWQHCRFHALLALGLRHIARAVAHGNDPHGRRPHPDPRKEALDRVLLDARSTTAVTTAIATDTDVVMVWGAAHLPGIAASLGDHGYQADPADTRWHTVGLIPPVRASTIRYLLRRPPAPHLNFHTTTEPVTEPTS
ncbi:hypothetical protein [Micromonospora rosaria]|uniref:hypothetical protein n=1 Tax=Micromonospora rosaria TaxID=47874 RepID=UPI0012FAE90F|nr:hypothetical protein [Micromonospora rosaria]